MSRIERRLQQLERQRMEATRREQELKSAPMQQWAPTRPTSAEVAALLAGIGAEQQADEDRLIAELGEDGFAAHQAEQRRQWEADKVRIREIEIKPEWLWWGYPKDDLSEDEVLAVSFHLMDELKASQRESEQIAAMCEQYSFTDRL